MCRVTRVRRGIRVEPGLIIEQARSQQIVILDVETVIFRMIRIWLEINRRGFMLMSGLRLVGSGGTGHRCLDVHRRSAGSARGGGRVGGAASAQCVIGWHALTGCGSTYLGHIDLDLNVRTQIIERFLLCTLDFHSRHWFADSPLLHDLLLLCLLWFLLRRAIEIGSGIHGYLLRHRLLHHIEQMLLMQLLLFRFVGILV
mmetsp:Transcript_72426/g.115503  ORF Transcript_72426/g.115503 Transcript_72426/m.115503 type:complete len:200 (+) Transcript_72426:264-863(+)